MSNTEKLLTALVEETDVSDIKCKSRIDELLKKCCCGEACDDVTPKSNTEKLLKKLNEKMINGGGGSASIYKNVTVYDSELTTLPNTGEVLGIHINVDKSNEDIIKQLDTLPDDAFLPINAEMSGYIIACCNFLNVYYYPMIIVTDPNRNGYAIAFGPNMDMMIGVWEGNSETDGWQQSALDVLDEHNNFTWKSLGFDVDTITLESTYSFNGVDVPVGQHNNLLVGVVDCLTIVERLEKQHIVDLKGEYEQQNITVTPTEETQTVKANDGKILGEIIIEGTVIPEGTLTVDKAGTYDVTEYEEAIVDICSLQDFYNARGSQYLFYNCKDTVVEKYLNYLTLTSYGGVAGLFSGSSITKIPNNFDITLYSNLGLLFYATAYLENVEDLDLSKATVLDSMFKAPSTLSGGLHTISIKNMPEKDASALYMFENCNNLTAVNGLDLSNITKVEGIFSSCGSLEELTGALNLQKVTSIENMFKNCRSIKTLEFTNTNNITSIGQAFYGCTSLETLKGLDLINVTETSIYTSFIQNCTNITNLILQNIKTSLQVGSSTVWGHLLTLDSLIGLCKECINTGSALTLTVGSANIEKLANVYVKLTGEAEENSNYPKLPMVQCESTDEGAMLISEYMLSKGWTLQ